MVYEAALRTSETAEDPRCPRSLSAKGQPYGQAPADAQDRLEYILPKCTVGNRNIRIPDDVEIYSSIATASAAYIMKEAESLKGNISVHKLYNMLISKDVKCKKFPKCLDHYNDDDYTSLYKIQEIFGTIGINFFRVTLSDKTLFNHFSNNEFPKWFPKWKLQSSRNIVLLLTEQDTLYGQSLPDSFTRSFPEYFGNKEETNCESRQGLYCIRHYPYLRGLDGEVLSDNEKATASDKSREKDSKSKNTGVNTEQYSEKLERYTGDSQFDYLRKLASFAAADAERDGDKVIAIGVLGSDVYDKLLVLQAFRNRFHDALRFTTDLDARLLHPSETGWARGLVVLSTFGLRPERGIQGNSWYNGGVFEKWHSQIEPIFRDSYQTALFTTVPIALGNAAQDDWKLRKMLSENLVPHVHEVGRYTEILLGQMDEDSINIYFTLKIAGIFSISIVLIWIFLQSSAVWWGASAIVVPVVLVAIVAGPQGGDGEPYSLEAIKAGISIWPVEIIRLVAAFLSVYWLFHSSRTLTGNGSDLSVAYGIPLSLAREIAPQPRAVSGLMSPVWRMFGPVFLAQGFYRIVFRDGVGEVASIWHRYLGGNDGVPKSGKARFWRVFLFTFIFLIAALTLFSLTRFPNAPVRGDIAHIFDKVFLALAVISLTALLFYVADQILTCCRMVEAMIRAEEGGEVAVAKWPADIYAKLVSKKLPRARLTASSSVVESRNWLRRSVGVWFLIGLIRDRTKLVGKLTYFPFLIFLIMAASRTQVFDRMDFPPALLAVILASVSVVVVCSLSLHRAAENARERALTEMVACKALAEGEGDEASVRQLDLLRDEVAQENGGAFRPLTQQPVIWALFLPFGGYGGIFMLDTVMRGFN